MRPGEGSWQRGLDHRSILCGDVAKNRRGGAPEGAPARKGRRGAFAKVPQCDLRRSGAPPPSGEARNTRESPGQDDREIWRSAHSLRGAEEACPHAKDEDSWREPDTCDRPADELSE